MAWYGQSWHGAASQVQAWRGAASQGRGGNFNCSRLFFLAQTCQIFAFCGKRRFMANQKFTFSGSVLISHEATKAEEIEQMIRYGINGLAFVEEIQVEVKPPEVER